MLTFMIVFVGGYILGLAFTKRSGPLKVVGEVHTFVRVLATSIFWGGMVACIFRENGDHAFGYTIIAWISGLLGAMENGSEKGKTSEEVEHKP